MKIRALLSEHEGQALEVSFLVGFQRNVVREVTTYSLNYSVSNQCFLHKWGVGKQLISEYPNPSFLPT